MTGTSARDFWSYEWMRTMVRTVLTVVLLFTFFFRAMYVQGESMRETLQDRDLMLVVNSWLCGEYRTGEAVIVRTPAFNAGRPIVKRVIATAGQTVDIDFDSGDVYVDGALLNEPYLREATLVDEGMSFPLTVPEGCIFVMGDNRNRSDDSRDPLLGPVDVRYVIGRAALVVFPGVTADTGKRDFGRLGRIL